MKKVIFLLMIVSCLSLSSCEIYNSLSNELNKMLNYYYDYDELIENLSNVEIVELNKTLYGDIIVLKSLSYEESLELLYDFSKIEHHNFLLGDPPVQTGISIRVWYLDGTNEVYSNAGATVSIWSWCSEEEFDNLIAKYLDE